MNVFGDLLLPAGNGDQTLSVDWQPEALEDSDFTSLQTTHESGCTFPGENIGALLQPTTNSEDACADPTTPTSSNSGSRAKRQPRIENVYSCQTAGCNKVYNHAHALRTHVQYVHTVDSMKPFRCTEYAKGFVKSRDLQRHARAHSLKKDTTSDPRVTKRPKSASSQVNEPTTIRGFKDSLCAAIPPSSSDHAEWAGRQLAAFVALLSVLTTQFTEQEFSSILGSMIFQFLLYSMPSDPNKPRVCTYHGEQFDAECQDYVMAGSNTHVVLKRHNGRLLEIPCRCLGAEDVLYILEQLKQKLNKSVGAEKEHCRGVGELAFNQFLGRSPSCTGAAHEVTEDG